jgi:redox-sensitive bicupin YhaK (pirin superfamily)
MDVRQREAISTIERDGYRFRQYLGDLATASDLFSSVHVGYGALRVFDDVIVDPGATASFQAYDGLETVAYVLEGAAHITHAGDPPVEVKRGTAARIVGGHGTTYEGHNRGSSRLRIALAAFVAPRAHEQAPFASRSFDPETTGLTWVATPSGKDHDPASLPLGAPVSFGIASLDSGERIRIHSVLGSGLYLSVLDGDVEHDGGFLDEGGDAKISLEAHTVSLQGITRATVAVIEVRRGFVQEIF